MEINTGRRFLIVLLAVELLVVGGGAIGCHRLKHVTNTPVGVSEQQVISWYAATGALKVISETTRTATASYIALHNTAAMPDEHVYQAGLEGLGRLAQSGLVATQFLGDVPKDFNGTTATKLAKYTADLTAAAEQVNTIGLSGIKNEQRKLELQTMLTQISSAIHIIEALQPGQTLGVPNGN